MDLLGDILVPSFFVTSAMLTLFIGYWINKQKSAAAKSYGLGMMVASSAMFIWAFGVITKPENLELLIGISVVPFLAGQYFFLLTHEKNYKFATRSMLHIGFLAFAAFTFIYRTAIAPSEPYFSEEGLLYFNVDEVVSWLYIAIFSFAWLPAILELRSKITDAAVKRVFSINAFGLFIGSIILISNNNDALLTINGFMMSASYLPILGKALSQPTFKVKK